MVFIPGSPLSCRPFALVSSQTKPSRVLGVGMVVSRNVSWIAGTPCTGTASSSPVVGMNPAPCCSALEIIAEASGSAEQSLLSV